MRVLIDHGSYEHQNLGDFAMLVAAVEHVLAQVPDAEISVITVNPAALSRALPTVIPVCLPAVPLMPPGRRLQEKLRVRWKYASKTGICFAGGLLAGRVGKTWRGSRRCPALLRAILDADVVLAAGGGYWADSFKRVAGSVLATLALAQKLGKRTAVVGAGLGPLEDRALRARCERVFRRVDLLTLREAEQGPRLADWLGLCGRYEVTGDEALALSALRERGGMRPAQIGGGSLGVNVRNAAYADVGASAFVEVREVLSELSRTSQVKLAPVPILTVGDRSDLVSIRAATPAEAHVSEWTVPSTPSELADRVMNCRAVLTGSYHAAVFALAIGVPVVAVANSTYYAWKFGGLAALYGDEMVQVVATDNGFASRLTGALTDAWDLGCDQKERALAVSARLAESQDAAYARLFRRSSNEIGRRDS